MRLGRRSRSRPGSPFSKRALLQHVNRELWMLAGDLSELELYCECGRDDCGASVTVTREEFAATRPYGACAIVVADHAGAEPVLARFAGFVVVTDTEAADASASTDR